VVPAPPVPVGIMTAGEGESGEKEFERVAMVVIVDCVWLV